MSQYHRSNFRFVSWGSLYLKTAWRTMRKNKLYTFLNITGMAVAFTCSILLFLSVYRDFSFDKFHQNNKRIFKVYDFTNGPDGAGLSSTMGYPVAPALKDENIGIEKATRIKYGGSKVRYKDKELELSTFLVDNDFFSMFSFPILKGNKINPLAGLGDAVISEEVAGKIFGQEDPVGKPIEVEIGHTWKSLVVASVIQTRPKNSSINYEVMARPEISEDYAVDKNNWNHQHHSVYVQIAAGTNQGNVESRLRALLKKYNPHDDNLLKTKGYKPDAKGDIVALRLLPLSEVHFNTQIGSNGAVSKSFLYILILTGIVILIIACFNFVNLSIGLSFTRTKEIGIRKCLGADKRQVWLQIWGESLLTAFLAMVLGIVAVVLLINGFNKIFVTKIDASLLYQPSIVLLLLGILLLVSFFAGSYPAFIMTSLKTVAILKGKVTMKTSGLLRNTLVVVQFTIACVLICTTIVIFKQFQHLRTAPLGYNTAAIISVPLYNQAKGKELVNQMRMRLLSQPSIVSVTGSSVNLGLGEDKSSSKSTSDFEYKGKSVNTNWMKGDYDFLKTLSIIPLEGRDFSTAYISDSAHAVIVTESMAKQLGSGSVAGLSFYSDSSKPKLNIVGVIPDFHLYSMFEKSEPLTITLDAGMSMNYILVRVNTKNPTATIDLVKKAYSEIEPGKEFKGSFVDENVDRWYNDEKRLSQMFSIAAMVAVVLSCMGLFGIALIVIRQRVKEIGVRKVLGASAAGIAAMVTKDFIRPVIIAIIIAMPVAWWLMSKWLQDFAYRINIEWWIFLVTGAVALLVAIITVSFQAIKAAVANPVKSLRSE
ncbi:MAG: FtsX-like permease family protein [Ferruginibacter sp.]